MALYQSSSVFFCIGMWNLKNFSRLRPGRPAQVGRRLRRRVDHLPTWSSADIGAQVDDLEGPSKCWSRNIPKTQTSRWHHQIPKHHEQITNKSRTNHLNHFNKSSDGDFCTRKSLWLLQAGTGEIREWSSKEMVTAPENMWKVPSEHQNIGLWPLNTADDLGRCAKILLVVWDHRLVDSAVFSATS